VNAILRGFVHTARGFGLEVLGSRYGFEGLVNPAGLVPLTVADVRGILPLGGCMLGCSTRVNPFFVDGGHERPTDRGPLIVEHLRALGVEALVLIGGDGTMLAAERFEALGMPCVGLPKTIDKDLGQTEITCGFDSAVETATRAVDALHSTAEAHARVMLLEVMGRNAGFIALHAGVAGGADVILIPEIPYRLERVVAKIRERERLGLRFSLIVVAEGARPAGGDVLEVEGGRPGHLPRLGGASARLLQELEAQNLGHEIRLTVLGHLQRGGSPSAFDRNLGMQLGSYGAELCSRKEYGRRVVVRGGKLRSIPLLGSGEAARHTAVDVDDGLARTARLAGVELGEAAEATVARAFHTRAEGWFTRPPVTPDA
jgi:6-phosphofructokinase 1